MTATQTQTKKCEVCAVVIERNKKLSSRQWERKRFCSFICGGKYMNRNRVGSWNKGRKCPELGGANHHLWKGGVTPLNELFRKTREYLEWRRHVFERDDYTCQACGKRGGDLHADHVLPFAYYPNLRLDILNGQTLCKPCHRKTPTYGERGKGFNEDERSIEEALQAIE